MRRLINVGSLGDNESGAAARAFPVILHVAIANDAIEPGKVRAHGGHDNPVSDL
jgi:hypothetical protein